MRALAKPGGRSPGKYMRWYFGGRPWKWVYRNAHSVLHRRVAERRRAAAASGADADVGTNRDRALRYGKGSIVAPLFLSALSLVLYTGAHPPTLFIIVRVSECASTILFPKASCQPRKEAATYNLIVDVSERLRGGAAASFPFIPPKLATRFAPSGVRSAPYTRASCPR